MAPRRPAGADASSAPVPVASPAVTRQPDDGSLYAALDLGTNSCRMLIARPMGSQFQVIDSFSKPVQLGHGLEASGRLSGQSMIRTVHALQVCRHGGVVGQLLVGDAQSDAGEDEETHEAVEGHDAHDRDEPQRHLPAIHGLPDDERDRIAPALAQW